MRVCKDLDHRGLAASAVVTVGVFDGLHRGHRALIDRARSLCLDGEVLALVTFEPLPLVVVDPQRVPARIIGTRQKLELLRAAGVDLVWMMRFNQQLASTPARAFAALLKAGLNARHVVVGSDFHFGHRREGDFARLQALGGEHGFGAESLPPVLVDGQRVSSTAVRTALSQGEFGIAERLLGRAYTLSGRVLRGRALGRELGFPTANLRPPPGRLALSGVFAVRARIGDGTWRDGVANLGCRPAVGGGEALLETHVFDFNGELYGRRMEVKFVKKLRDEAHFDRLDELVAQMKIDEVQARSVLAGAGNSD